MPAAFPGPPVAIKITRLVLGQTIRTNKNPFFSLANLYSIHHGMLFLATGAGFRFHDSNFSFRKLF